MKIITNKNLLCAVAALHWQLRCPSQDTLPSK